MRISEKALKRFARKLLELSMEEGGNISTDRVTTVLQHFREEPISQVKQLLKLYLYYIKKEINRSKIIVEHAGPLELKDATFLSEALASRNPQSNQMNFKEAPELIAGLKITIGDNVWENSVKHHLQTLRKKIS